MARILVTDDNVDVLNLLAHHLRKRDHDVIAVETPQQALRLVAAGLRPDVAVLDVMMPLMSGFKLLKALRGHEGLEQLPVVFVSARVQREDVAAGRALGATYLTKPFRVAELTGAVEEALTPPEEVSGSAVSGSGAG